jgi:hypothetical protein
VTVFNDASKNNVILALPNIDLLRSEPRVGVFDVENDLANQLRDGFGTDIPFIDRWGFEYSQAASPSRSAKLRENACIPMKTNNLQDGGEGIYLAGFPKWNTGYCLNTTIASGGRLSNNDCA